MKKMRSGKILIKLLKQGEPEPIINATVVIGKGDSSRTYLTDGDGRIEIPCDAPPMQLSFLPRSVTRPYSLCDLLISAPKINDIHMIACQVFPEVVTLLNCEVQPLINGMVKKKSTIRIPVHGLWAENPNNRDGGIYIGTFPAVNKKTYNINDHENFSYEFITLHLGRENDEAMNKTISFADYIKNVASGMFYPTWSKEALCACILSVITKAKNRIHTRYYRNLGYPFDIAIEKDLLYFEGRMLFAPICEIAEELLGQTILTEKELTFSPWQNLLLAQKGFTAEEILKYIHGNDIRIVKNEGSQSALFTEPLKKGSIKSEVKTMQQLLNRIALQYPSIPVIREAEGCFGANSEASVKVYQRLFGLPETGCVDAITWQSIVFVSGVLGKYAAKNNESKEQSNKNTEKVTLFGDNGDAVIRLQHLINRVSRICGEKLIKPVDVNGTFDENTRESITTYQKYKNLPKSGVCDHETLRCLNREIEKESSAQEKKYPGTPVVREAEGDQVVYLQNALNAVYEKLFGKSVLEVDGIFGEETQKLVVKTQELFGLEQNGLVDEKTWNAILNEQERITNTDLQTGYCAEG